MKIDITYYTLLKRKEMSDSTSICEGCELIFIKKDPEDDFIFFETNEKDSKRLFWATEEEVEFLRESSEDWDEIKIKQRNNFIKGKFI